MKSRLFLYGPYCYGLVSALLVGLGIVSYYGDVKSIIDISWLDVFSEGGMVILALFWLVLLLRSRPAGRVTMLLALGLCGIIFSWSMDVLDEFIHLPSSLIWRNWIESLPVPISLLALSAGIYHWHQEEIAISEQMVKRERYFREHRFFDKLIPVGGAAYLRKQLKLSLAEAKQDQSPLALVAIDIDNFNFINRQYGHEEGDHILQLLCQLLLIQLGNDDLICRLAGDRFVVLLSETNEYEAKQLSLDLQRTIAHTTFRTKHINQRITLTASVAVTMMSEQEDSDSFIKRLNLDLANVKHTISSAL